MHNTELTIAIQGQSRNILKTFSELVLWIIFVSTNLTYNFAAQIQLAKGEIG